MALSDILDQFKAALSKKGDNSSFNNINNDYYWYKRLRSAFDQQYSRDAYGYNAVKVAPFGIALSVLAPALLILLLFLLVSMPLAAMIVVPLVAITTLTIGVTYFARVLVNAKQHREEMQKQVKDNPKTIENSDVNKVAALLSLLLEGAQQSNTKTKEVMADEALSIIQGKVPASDIEMDLLKGSDEFKNGGSYNDKAELKLSDKIYGAYLSEPNTRRAVGKNQDAINYRLSPTVWPITVVDFNTKPECRDFVRHYHDIIKQRIAVSRVFQKNPVLDTSSTTHNSWRHYLNEEQNEDLDEFTLLDSDSVSSDSSDKYNEAYKKLSEAVDQYNELIADETYQKMAHVYISQMRAQDHKRAIEQSGNDDNSSSAEAAFWGGMTGGF